MRFSIPGSGWNKLIAKGKKMHNVKDFGAVGNGLANDTAAIQKAIDAGGMVFFPPGIYRSGTLYLRSHGGLHLEAGAILQASADKADYNADDFCPQNWNSPAELVSGAHFIIGLEAENITLCGEGRIDGSRQSFYGEKSLPDPDRTAQHCEIFDREELRRSWRPAQMIFFCECRNIKIRDIELYNSPYWSCFLHGCEDVQVRGLRILNDQRTINGDGIDIDCCRRVTVSDCIIDTGDDCITLRGGEAKLKKSRPCEYITISNCQLHTCCNAFRIGVGTGIVRKAVISNCMIHQSRTGINICSQYSPGRSVQIEDIHFENIFIESVKPISFQTNAWGKRLGPSPKQIRNISLHHVRGSGHFCNTIAGDAPGNICNVRLSDVELEYSGGAQITSDPEKDICDGVQDSAPAVFYCIHTEDLSITSSRVHWHDADPRWQFGVLAENCPGLELSENHFGKPDQIR